MPVEKDYFDRIKKDIDEADNAFLKGVAMDFLSAFEATCPVDTGNLRGSHRAEFGEKEVTIGCTADYGYHVHEGTSRMRARPWLKDAATQNAEHFAAQNVEKYAVVIRP